MTVRIFTLKNGLEEIKDVIAIRIKSNDYNLLILKDYLSIMGKIDGSFEIETKDEKKKYDSIKAYYMNHNNQFNIILEEE